MLCPSCGRDNPSDAQFCNGCGANLDTPVAETPTPPEGSRILTSGSFVGRQREMADLRVALADAISGQGRLVMLVGEPGIGKTRTAQELAAQAQMLGAQVLWGGCHEEEGAPPYTARWIIETPERETKNTIRYQEDRSFSAKSEFFSTLLVLLCYQRFKGRL